MRRLRRILRRLFRDRGDWSYTMTVDRGVTDSAIRRVKTKQAEIYLVRARECCKQFGHSLFHGRCLICQELVGDVTVDAALVGAKR